MYSYRLICSHSVQIKKFLVMHFYNYESYGEIFLKKCIWRDTFFHASNYFLSLTFSHLKNLFSLKYTFTQYILTWNIKFVTKTQDTLYDEQKNSIILWLWIFRLKALRRQTLSWKTLREPLSVRTVIVDHVITLHPSHPFLTRRV